MNKGILFDVDGTLWDSAAQVAESWNEVLERYPHLGVRITAQDMYDNMGKTMMDIGKTLFPRRKLTEDLIQVRVMLEPPIAALAAQNATAEDIRELEDILLGLEERMIRRKDYSDKDSQFHAQIANCSHNLVMTNLVPRLINN